MTRVLVEVGGRKCRGGGDACSRAKGERERKGIEKRVFWCWSTNMMCSRRGQKQEKKRERGE